MTAFVFGDHAASRRDGSRVVLRIATSTNTGTAPYWIIGETVVRKPAAYVITSSPEGSDALSGAGSQCHKSKQIRRRSGVYQRTVTHTEILRKCMFKFVCITSGCQPEFKENCLPDLPFLLHRILWTHMECGHPPDMVSAFDYDICCSNSIISRICSQPAVSVISSNIIFSLLYFIFLCNIEILLLERNRVFSL